MKLKLILLLFILPFIKLNAQNKTNILYGKIDKTSTKTLYFFTESLYGKKLIDSTTVINGAFKFSYNSNLFPVFIYFSEYSDSRTFISIFNDESIDNIKFKTVSPFFIDSMEFSNSTVNKNFYNCLKLIKMNLVKLYFIQNILINYPYKDAFYIESNKKYWAYLDDFKKRFKNSNSKLLKESKQILLYHYLDLQYQLAINELQFKKNNLSVINCFDIVNENISLVNTDIIGEVFQKYVEKIYTDSIPQLKMETIFNDSIFNLFKSNHFNHTLIEKISNYYIGFLLAHNYFTALSDYLKVYPNKYIDKDFKAQLLSGEQIKTIKGRTKDGYIIDINDFKSNYKLVFIWSNECNHCLNIIPGLNNIFTISKIGEIEFYSFCVQEKDTVSKNPFLWSKSAFILKSWENEFLKKYNINYTPLILLLNAENVIIDIPIDERKLRFLMAKLNLLKDN